MFGMYVQDSEQLSAGDPEDTTPQGPLDPAQRSSCPPNARPMRMRMCMPVKRSCTSADVRASSHRAVPRATAQPEL
ncbi:hypothetical protein L7F22_000715, partial [Adiantum nelumboides]|nr:hypothetical protein [Adiantum nelumboides]